MFVLLKHTNNYKGILVIAHIEGKFFQKNMNITNELLKHYYIYHHYSNWTPNPTLSFKPCVYYTEDIFNNSYNITEVNNYLIPYIKKINPTFNVNKDNKLFDFICLGRCTPYKKTYETLELMIFAAKTYGSTSFLFLDCSEETKDYTNKVINLYNTQKDLIKKNIVILTQEDYIDKKYFNDDKFKNTFNKGISYNSIAYLLNTSVTYIHLREGFDEARLIGQALLCGCKIFCSNKLVGHNEIRSKNSLAIIQFDNAFDSISSCINNKYIYDKNIDLIYKGKIQIPIKLKEIYNTHSYNKYLDYDSFYNLCDKILWTLKLPAHYPEYPWVLPPEKNFLIPNNKVFLLSHIITKEQYNHFLKTIFNDIF